MATTKKAHRKPLVVTLLNAKGEPIQGIILAGKLPDEDPTLILAREMGDKYKALEPTPIAK
ncbi:hypothetical protein J2I47_24380 [Fibrella sp. HMF5335]|uniref:Uncharacterized protein n=1 Tax=Fibrella rubiginis TaxID=2817060 RepID=A0A939GJY2_9BACT|nr:hypothetical protein [Fibrella rubiginis]MBO0939706.1 hypothetical protein [Fibrella rubiginis]